MSAVTPHKLCGALAVSIIAVALLAPATAQTIEPTKVTRPAGTKPFTADPAALLATGIKRHDDTSLSPAGRSCNTCHTPEDSYNPTFNKPYAHFVGSVKSKTGLDEITAEGMVQFCMISAMGAAPLDWESETLAALTAFVLERNRKAIARASGKSSMVEPPVRSSAAGADMCDMPAS